LRHVWILCAALALLALALVGCGKKVPTDPKGVVQQFDAAMKAGKLDKAAELFDYETSARQQNGDWDTFGEGQRKLIVKKLQEDKAKELEQAQSAWTSAGYQVGEAQVQGAQATVPLKGTTSTLTVTLVQVEGKWLIQSIM